MPNKYDVSDIASISAPDNGNDILSISAPEDKTTIGQDILQGFSDVPGIAYEGLKAIPGQVMGVYNQIDRDPLRAMSNAVTGLVNTGKGIANLPSNAMQYLGKKGLVSNEAANFFPRSPLDKTDVAKLMGIKGDEQQGDALLQALGGYGPFGVAGEVGELGALGRAGARSGASATYGASQGQNPITSALLAPVTEGMIKAPIAAGQGIVSGANKLRPSSLLSGNLSNEELARNLQATEGTNALLGDVLGSPTLKKTYENDIGPMIGSGSDKAYSLIGKQIEDKGKDLINTLKNKTNIGEEDSDQVIKDLLMKSKEEHTKTKNSLYKDRDILAAKEDFKPDVTNFVNLANKMNIDLSNSPETESISGLNKLKNKTEDYSNVKPKLIDTGLLDQYGKPVKNIGNELSLNGATNLKSDIYSQAKDLLSSSVGSERTLGSKYMQLYDALNKDINNSLANKASPELQQAHATANKFYSDEFTNFLDRDLKNQLDEKKPSENIIRTIINGTKSSDKYSRIKRIQDMLPSSDKNTLAAAYLKNSLDDDKLKITGDSGLYTMLNSLGKRQFNALIPDKKIQEQAEDFMRLKEMSTEPMRRMSNPDTGARGISALSSIMQAALTGIGGAAGGAPGALMGLSAPIALSRVATKYVTSPKVRKNMVEAIMKNQNKANEKNIPHLYLNKFKGYSDQAINKGVVPYDITNQEGNR